MNFKFTKLLVESGHLDQSYFDIFYMTSKYVAPSSHRLIKIHLFCITILHLGSAHTILASFWSARLQKNDFYGEFSLFKRSVS